MQKRELTVSYLPGTPATTPYIRLKGKWLLHAGFRYKDQIKVSVVSQGTILIENMTKKKSDL